MKEPEVICTRITARMKEKLEEMIDKDTHLNISEWLRVAARQKFENDYPDEFAALKEGE